MHKEEDSQPFLIGSGTEEELPSVKRSQSPPKRGRKTGARARKLSKRFENMFDTF